MCPVDPLTNPREIWYSKHSQGGRFSTFCPSSIGDWVGDGWRLAYQKRFSSSLSLIRLFTLCIKRWWWRIANSYSWWWLSHTLREEIFCISFSLSWSLLISRSPPHFRFFESLGICSEVTYYQVIQFLQLFDYSFTKICQAKIFGEVNIYVEENSNGLLLLTIPRFNNENGGHLILLSSILIDLISCNFKSEEILSSF
jgi:hypothetical protein